MTPRSALRGALLFGPLALVATTVIACAAPREVRIASEGLSPVSTGSSKPVVPSTPNVVGANCDAPNCEASCLPGSSILLAYGFHGRTYDSGGPVSSKCGEAVEWLGGCIGLESCSISTKCTSSAMYLICR